MQAVFQVERLVAMNYCVRWENLSCIVKHFHGFKFRHVQTTWWIFWNLFQLFTEFIMRCARGLTLVNLGWRNWSRNCCSLALDRRSNRLVKTCFSSVSLHFSVTLKLCSVSCMNTFSNFPNCLIFRTANQRCPSHVGRKQELMVCHELISSQHVHHLR